MANDRGRELDSHLVEFGERLRLLRLERRLSQEQLAHEAGLHRTVVGFIERGEREVGISKLWPLAEALGVQVAELFKG
jgi:transcriptional regulator with XRE-family HTH domain